ncbi:NACHT domain-containing protein [Kitasatospora sp. NPDC127116]|uniref:NACHT domain-containing protein n=1 Tax=Kitasatospora sp. NPDC127116 TaxID=3345367 RepID=UPI00364272B7
MFDDSHTAGAADITAYYQATTPARLVVTGAPGAGKTVLALELLLGLIEHRGDTDPVPVRMSLAAWDTDIPLEAFLIAHLVQNLDWPRDRAAQLVEHGLVLPILDGLDEMDSGLTGTVGQPVREAGGRPSSDPHPPRARAALAALNAYGRGRTAGPLVLTCRTTHYEALVDAAQLRDAARISIEPVPPQEALRYLADRSGGTPRWQTLLEHLRTDPTGVLAQSLSTPWRLSLAATVYSRAGDPIELRALVTPQDVDDHLLNLLIPATLALHPPKRRYTSDDTRRWLTSIARSLQRPDPTSETPAVEPLAEPRTEIHIHELWVIVEDRVIQWEFLLLVPMPLFLGGLYVQGSPFPFQTLLLALWGTTTGFVAWGNEHLPRRLNWSALEVPEFRQNIVDTCKGALAASIGIGIVTGVIVGLSAEAKVGVTTGIVVGLMGVLLGLLSSLLGELEGPPATVAGPGAVLRSDILYRITVGFVCALLAGLAFGSLFGLVDGFAAGLLWGSLFGLTIFVMSVATSAYGRYFIFLLSLRLYMRRALPFRLNAFLAWSYDAGLIRLSGNAYQFRHREFQRWLTSHPFRE